MAHKYHPACLEARCVYTLPANCKNYLKRLTSHFEAEHGARPKDELRKGVKVGLAQRVSKNYYVMLDLVGSPSRRDSPRKIQVLP